MRERHRTSATRTFRVFVSSTFKDMEAERNVLQEKVFPALKELCQSWGHRFQEIDLRWGVSEEASLDQQAMNICLAEIERCRDLTPRPNFIVLLSNHYGWLALPPRIPADQFEQIRDNVPPNCQDELGNWYAKDENADPAEYYLLPREEGGPYEKYEDWAPVEHRLYSILTHGVRGTRLEADPRFCASATEQEILAGAIGIGGPAGHAFAFIRELQPPYPDPAQGDPVLDFLDPDQAQPAGRKDTPLGRLKAKLEAELPVKTYQARWDAEAGRPTLDHLDDLAQDVREALAQAIRDEIHDPSPRPRRNTGPDRIEAHDALGGEGKAHRDFAEERCRVFVGRKDSLLAIATYLADTRPRPLVVSGEGGTGKSALLAEALRRTQRDHPESELMYRFIGATPQSSDGRSLLAGLCGELARRGYGGDETSVPAGYRELSADFRERLEAAGTGRPLRPLILFLDSLDQLWARQGARGLAWLPALLPDGVRMVISTRPGDTLDTMIRRGVPVAELGPLERADGAELLQRWLAEAGRSLQPEQERAVLAKFQASMGNPLYLRLAFEEARWWTSGQNPEDLVTGVAGIIARNTYGRLAAEDNHGEVLVSRTLGYLAAARHGLSEDELLDVLSRDLDVYEWFLRGARHVPVDLTTRAAEAGVGERLDGWLKELRAKNSAPPGLRSFLKEIVPRPGGPRLPFAYWARLAFDLRPYLTERAAEGASLIGFYHQELGDMAAARYLAGRELSYHGRLADYFQPEPDGANRREWAETTLHGLGELPYQLTKAGEKRWDDLYKTLTDFAFLEAKASRADVYSLQDDFDLALGAMARGENTGQPRIIVTATDFGQGMIIRCPHCGIMHTFSEECAVCKRTHKLADWRGKERACTNPGCNGPLKVNEFQVGPTGSHQRLPAGGSLVGIQAAHVGDAEPAAFIAADDPGLDRMQRDRPEALWDGERGDERPRRKMPQAQASVVASRRHDRAIGAHSAVPDLVRVPCEDVEFSAGLQVPEPESAVLAA